MMTSLTPNAPSTTDPSLTVGPQLRPLVRWVADDVTSPSDTVDKPISQSTCGIIDDRYWRYDHRAVSLPNLAEENRATSNDDERCTENGDEETPATEAVAMATGVNTVLSLVTSAANSMTSSQSQSKSVGRNANNKTKRAASFAERPVISAVSWLYFTVY